MIVDMHCHADFYEDPLSFAHDAKALKLALLAVTCSPKDYMRVTPLLENSDNIRLAVGLHPWWVSKGLISSEDLELFLKLMDTTSFIGEIGLDFSPAHVSPTSFSFQQQAFYQIAKRAAQLGNKVLSLHSVKSASVVLDILEETKCCNSCTVIFHWFSGSSQELWRAIHAGAGFSINPRMLQTKRGREYVKLIPKEKLFLESDYPPQKDAELYGAKRIVNELTNCAHSLQELRGFDVLETSSMNAQTLLNLRF